MFSHAAPNPFLTPLQRTECQIWADQIVFFHHGFLFQQENWTRAGTWRNQTTSLGLKLTKISRSFKQSLQSTEMSFCFFGAVLEIPGVDWNKESKWSLLIHPTCCPSRLRHEPCSLEGGRREEPAQSLCSSGLTTGCQPDQNSAPGAPKPKPTSYKLHLPSENTWSLQNSLQKRA